MAAVDSEATADTTAPLPPQAHASADRPPQGAPLAPIPVQAPAAAHAPADSPAEEARLEVPTPAAPAAAEAPSEDHAREAHQVAATRSEDHAREAHQVDTPSEVPVQAVLPVAATAADTSEAGDKNIP